MTPDSRLDELEAVCRRLWPYVRYFAMSGACIDAIDAVVELGRLLGETPDSPENLEAQAVEVRDETLKRVAEWLENDLSIRGRIGSKAAAEIASKLRDNSREHS